MMLHNSSISKRRASLPNTRLHFLSSAHGLTSINPNQTLTNAQQIISRGSTVEETQETTAYADRLPPIDTNNQNRDKKQQHIKRARTSLRLNTALNGMQRNPVALSPTVSPMAASLREQLPHGVNCTPRTISGITAGGTSNNSLNNNNHNKVIESVPLDWRASISRVTTYVENTRQRSQRLIDTWGLSPKSTHTGHFDFAQDRRFSVASTTSAIPAHFKERNNNRTNKVTSDTCPTWNEMSTSSSTGSASVSYNEGDNFMTSEQSCKHVATKGTTTSQDVSLLSRWKASLVSCGQKLISTGKRPFTSSDIPHETNRFANIHEWSDCAGYTNARQDTRKKIDTTSRTAWIDVEQGVGSSNTPSKFSRPGISDQGSDITAKLAKRKFALSFRQSDVEQLHQISSFRSNLGVYKKTCISILVLLLAVGCLSLVIVTDETAPVTVVLGLCLPVLTWCALLSTLYCVRVPRSFQPHWSRRFVRYWNEITAIAWLLTAIPLTVAVYYHCDVVSANRPSLSTDLPTPTHFCVVSGVSGMFSKGLEETHFIAFWGFLCVLTPIVLPFLLFCHFRHVLVVSILVLAVTVIWPALSLSSATDPIFKEYLRNSIIVLTCALLLYMVAAMVAAWIHEWRARVQFCYQYRIRWLLDDLLHSQSDIAVAHGFRDRLVRLLELVPHMFVEYAPDFSFAYASPACQDLLGLTCSDLQLNPSMSGWESIHPDDKASLLNHLLQAGYTDEKIVSAQFRRRTADGSYRWVELRGRYLNRSKIDGLSMEPTTDIGDTPNNLQNEHTALTIDDSNKQSMISQVGCQPSNPSIKHDPISSSTNMRYRVTPEVNTDKQHDSLTDPQLTSRQSNTISATNDTGFSRLNVKPQLSTTHSRSLPQTPSTAADSPSGSGPMIPFSPGSSVQSFNDATDDVKLQHLMTRYLLAGFEHAVSDELTKTQQTFEKWQLTTAAGAMAYRHLKRTLQVLLSEIVTPLRTLHASLEEAAAQVQNDPYIRACSSIPDEVESISRAERLVSATVDEVTTFFSYITGTLAIGIENADVGQICKQVAYTMQEESQAVPGLRIDCNVVDRKAGTMRTKGSHNDSSKLQPTVKCDTHPLLLQRILRTMLHTAVTFAVDNRVQLSAMEYQQTFSFGPDEARNIEMESKMDQHEASDGLANASKPRKNRFGRVVCCASFRCSEDEAKLLQTMLRMLSRLSSLDPPPERIGTRTRGLGMILFCAMRWVDLIDADLGVTFSHTTPLVKAQLVLKLRRRLPFTHTRSFADLTELANRSSVQALNQLGSSLSIRHTSHEERTPSVMRTARIDWLACVTPQATQKQNSNTLNRESVDRSNGLNDQTTTFDTVSRQRKAEQPYESGPGNPAHSHMGSASHDHLAQDYTLDQNESIDNLRIRTSTQTTEDQVGTGTSSPLRQGLPRSALRSFFRDIAGKEEDALTNAALDCTPSSQPANQTRTSLVNNISERGNGQVKNDEQSHTAELKSQKRSSPMRASSALRCWLSPQLQTTNTGQHNTPVMGSGSNFSGVQSLMTSTGGSDGLSATEFVPHKQLGPHMNLGAVGILGVPSLSGRSSHSFIRRTNSFGSTYDLRRLGSESTTTSDETSLGTWRSRSTLFHATASRPRMTPNQSQASMTASESPAQLAIGTSLGIAEKITTKISNIQPRSSIGRAAHAVKIQADMLSNTEAINTPPRHDSQTRLSFHSSQSIKNMQPPISASRRHSASFARPRKSFVKFLDTNSPEGIDNCSHVNHTSKTQFSETSSIHEKFSKTAIQSEPMIVSHTNAGVQSSANSQIVYTESPPQSATVPLAMFSSNNEKPSSGIKSPRNSSSKQPMRFLNTKMSTQDEDEDEVFSITSPMSRQTVIRRLGILESLSPTSSVHSFKFDEQLLPDTNRTDVTEIESESVGVDASTAEHSPRSQKN